MAEFRKFGSIARLFRDCTITEKIDGTNACVVIDEFPFGWHTGGVDDEGVSHELPVLFPAAYVMGDPLPEEHPQWDGLPDKEYLVSAQSRTRRISPGKSTDNHGFAGWVWDNALALMRLLGPGYHYGEWWGSGINRNYGLTGEEKRFSLFNVHKWGSVTHAVPGLSVVPKLYVGPFSDDAVQGIVNRLELQGSVAAPGFMDPEGIIVYHHAAKCYFKYTLDGDGHKGV